MRSVVAAVAVGIVFGFVSAEDSVSLTEDPAAFYSMIELVCAEGYHIQEYKVVTEDGYIMRIFRIPSGKRRPKVPKRRTHYQYLHEGYHPDFGGCVNDSLREAPVGPPVLLSHGLIAASDVWVLQGPKSDLAFMLADKGYDVWFTNSRGNFYSRHHKTLKPSQLEFWNFSFHENGIYDMPATIDFVLSRTGVPKLTYIGHSMGTTMFFVMASEKPEYRDKVQFFVGLTPVARILRNHTSISRMNVFNATLNLLATLERNGVREFLPRSYITNFFARILCRTGSPFQDLCYDLSFFFTGIHSKEFLRKKLVTYIAHGMSGSSIKTFKHFAQTLDAPYFGAYDYGPEENFRRYGTAEPPEYDLRKVTVPTALYYSTADYLATEKDVLNLMRLLPNVVESFRFVRYNHVDFLWAYSAKKLVYDNVMELLDKFSSLQGWPGSEGT